MTESATENNRPNWFGVRVKTCGKSARKRLVTGVSGKPCVLKDQINPERLPARQRVPRNRRGG